MHAITPPLRPGDGGPEVANLQTGLTMLLSAWVLRFDPGVREELLRQVGDEGREQTYGDGTAKTVSIFQEQNRFDVTGAVDDPTADALNESLRGLGVLGGGGAAPPPPATVAGEVRTEDGAPFAARVLLYADDMRLGEGSTDPEGRYTIDYPRPAQPTALRVAAFDADGQNRAEATVEQPGTVERVDLVVRGAGRAYQVTGRVAGTGLVSGGLRLVVVDRNVGGDTTLAETVTDSGGGYRLTFTYGGGKEAPDLQAHAYQRDTRVGSSSVRYAAEHATVLDVTATPAAPAAVPEHVALTAALGAHYQGDLRHLRETADQGDVTYLANKTGWDARAVAMAALADRLAAATPGIPAALFYPLLRAGVPADEDALYSTDAGTVRAVWQRAIDDGMVAPELAGAVNGAHRAYLDRQAAHRVAAPAQLGASSLAEMLRPVLGDADRQKRFARLQMEHQGDPDEFWAAVTTAFGAPVEQRLRLDGKLGFLTVNNAPLIARLHSAPLTDPVQLLDRGLHRPSDWLPLITTVPPEIPGAGADERRANYAGLLSAQLRLSYPTATVAAMVGSGETPTTPAHTTAVRDFLRTHHDSFDINLQPIARFPGAEQTTAEVRAEIARIQRVRQITPGDEPMNALLHRGIDSAAAAARYDRTEFVRAFGDAVGGARAAALIHARAQQIHAAVLNITTSYVLASRAPGIGDEQIVAPAPGVPDNVGDVIAYPTLEKLLGEMDYCDCSDCRSVLSPAAYLVDLLRFLDRDDVRWAQFLDRWRVDHGGAPYPYATTAAWTAAGSPADLPPTPLAVLLSRRPDLQHLPLTCENTNTPVPYIDLVNEILEHFVAHGLSLTGFQGHTTSDAVAPDELLANPQYVQDAAYQVLAGAGEPEPVLPPVPQLPFHLPLRRLHGLLGAFEVPLSRVLETLRPLGAIDPDVWLAELGFSGADRDLLTDATVTLQRLYGFAPAVAQADVVEAVSTVRDFCQRLDVSYDDLLQVVRSRTVNPDGALIAKVQALEVPLTTLRAVHDGTMTDTDFAAAIAPQVDQRRYGGDIAAWVRDPLVYQCIMGLLVLADPDGGKFTSLRFRYADPAKIAENVAPAELIRLARFVRFWRQLGWSVEQSDRLITALAPAGGGDIWTTVLPRAGVVARALRRLGGSVGTDLPGLLACFAPMDTYGAGSLYHRLFGSPALLAQDPAFAEDRYGEVLDGTEHLLTHRETLRGALGVTGDELATIVAALGYDDQTALTIDTVTAVFRRAWLARRLTISVVELCDLVACTGIDPFGPIDAADPAILRLIDLVERLRATGLDPAKALAWLFNRGAAVPATDQVMRDLRVASAAIDADFAVAPDPDGQLARARMAMVYDQADTDLFFGLLDRQLVSQVPYRQLGGVLEDAVLAAAPGRIGYDDFRKVLTYTGLLTADMTAALRAAGSADFAAAVDRLYAENQRVVNPLFARHPELRPLHDAYASTPDLAQARTNLLAAVLPGLRQRRKGQQAVQILATAATTDLALAAAVLDDPAVLHGGRVADRPALDDLVAAEQPGLAAAFYLRDTVTGDPDSTEDAVADLDIRLPGLADGMVSVVLHGYVEAPATDFYQLAVDADPGAAVSLTLGGAVVPLDRTEGRWSNAVPLSLQAGSLTELKLTVQATRNTVSVRWRTLQQSRNAAGWQSTGLGWQVVPGRLLYPAPHRDRFRAAYLRFAKVTALVTALKLSPGEIGWLAAPGWCNDLPVGAEAAPAGFTEVLEELLGYALLKAAVSPDADSLLDAVRDAQPVPALARLGSWAPESVTALLDRFGKLPADLSRPATLRRVAAALELLTAVGVGAATLITVATIDPSSDQVNALQAALRARYASADWLPVIRPVNDDLRAGQRDALVAYVLHQMRAHPASAHIDTPDKLFEYFLTDVQMQPVTRTSRIRHAISTVQLFIERVLLNVEPRVAPSALNSAQYEWMKRYRVWEANRKVFLWPENWLEPELRDDPSPFFRTMMSELLQGDITEDRAAVAFGRYLADLAKVAKLEPVGMHVLEREPGTADDVVHLVARSAGTGRGYHWRRREGGFWTPWEAIKLDIDGDPVTPVVWRGRLFLFWLKVMVTPDLTPPPPPTGDRNLTQLKLAEIRRIPPPMQVTALLSWSEYANGSWGPSSTSDQDAPVTVVENTTTPFDRSSLRLTAIAHGDMLRIGIASDGWNKAGFVLYNTHSSPVDEESVRDKPTEAPGPRRYLAVDSDTFIAHYVRNNGGSRSEAKPLDRPILTNPLRGRVVAPTHELADPWVAPFLYADDRHVFHVRTHQREVTVRLWDSYVEAHPKPPSEIVKLPPLVIQPPPRPKPRFDPVVDGLSAVIAAPGPVERFVSEDAYISRGLGTLGTVTFDGAELGASGAVTERSR